jgi:hypothetical protein
MVGVLAIAVLGFGCGDDLVPSGDLFDQLRAVPGVTAVIERPALNNPGYRFFEITLEQPVAEGSSQSFTQYLSLLYIGNDKPVVLATTGYHDYLGERLSEPAVLLGANQIIVEHRYFGTSRPRPTDWTKLDIETSAQDFHHIVTKLRPLLGSGAWIGTGASKGGMTSVFHRRFFPDDLDATIAYVAPISLVLKDPSYTSFFDTVGTPACRQQVRDVERLTLQHKDAMLARAAADGYEFTIVGAEWAMELSIAEIEWEYWQYLGVQYCNFLVPAPATATDDELYNFLSYSSGVGEYADDQIDLYYPYYYQSATQLGNPSLPVANITDLLTIDPDDFTPLMPPGVNTTFDPAAMADIAQWMSTSAERVMLIYGQWDPWTAGAMDIGSSPDAFEFVAPQGTHGSGIGSLAPADRTQALSILQRWTGVVPTMARTTDAPSELVRVRPRL